MFERDLQEEILKVNKAFIKQALERAEEASLEKKTKVVVLSPLEDALNTVSMKDFSIEALRRYRTIANITDDVGSSAFNRRLLQQGLLKNEDGRMAPTGFGLLLFGKEPRNVMPQAGLLGTIHFSDGSEELQDFSGPQVMAPELALDWLRNKLPSPINRSNARRRSVNDPLFELVREGVVNALVHRDYTISGAKCQLIVNPDIIMVKSPGELVEPITLAQMQAFTAPMLSRNPVLHYVFARMELAEERGLGLKSMKEAAEMADLPLPRYAWEDPYLVLTLYRSRAAAINVLTPEVYRQLNVDERASWEYIVGQVSVTSSELERELGFDERKAQRVLKKLMDTGLLRRIGGGRATRYEVI